MPSSLVPPWRGGAPCAAGSRRLDAGRCRGDFNVRNL